MKTRLEPRRSLGQRLAGRNTARLGRQAVTVHWRCAGANPSPGVGTAALTIVGSVKGASTATTATAYLYVSPLRRAGRHR